MAEIDEGAWAASTRTGRGQGPQRPILRRPSPEASTTVPEGWTREMDFARYAGQLRPWTYRDAVVLAELEQELIEELDRALAKECGCDHCRERKE